MAVGIAGASWGAAWADTPVTKADLPADYSYTSVNAHALEKKAREYYGDYYTGEQYQQDFAAGLPDPEPSAYDENGTPNVEGIASHIIADKVTADGDIIHAEGNVLITVEASRLMCDNLTLDRQSGQVVATGNCLIYSEGNLVAAEWLTYNPDNHSIVVHNASGQARDLGLNSTSTAGVIFWADRMQWTKEKIDFYNITLTTCDKPTDDLDFKVTSEQMTVYPNDRLLSGKTSFYLYGHHALTLPSYNASLNLERRMERSFFPTIGNNSVDGWYLRTAIPYILNKDNYGAVLVGLNAKTGIGLGLEHCYRLGENGQGVAYYYRQNGDKTKSRYELRNNMYYNFDDENELTWDFKANRSEIPNEDGYNRITSNLNFRRRTERDTLYLSHNYSSNDSSTYNNNLRLYYNYKVTPELSALFNADLNTTHSSSAEYTKFHYSAGLRHTSELFDSDLMLENTSGHSLYHLNRLPELSLRSHPILIGDVPVLATASFSNISEYPSDVHTTRTELTLKVPNQVFDYGNGKLLAGAGVRQIFYGSGQSQYGLAAQAGWMQNFGDFGTLRLDYNWMQPTGETPIQHDLYNGYSNVTGGVEFFHDDLFNMAVVTGYNLRAERFQNVTPRLTIRPDNRWKFIFASSYDPNSSQWRSLDSNLTLQITDKISLSHWNVYDLVNNRFTYHDYQVNFDAHDWIGSIVYRGVQKELFFQFSLKAFALPDTNIGPDPTKAILPRKLPSAFTVQQ